MDGVGRGEGPVTGICGFVDGPKGVVYTVFIDGTKTIRRVCLLDFVVVARRLVCWSVAPPPAVLLPAD